MSHQDPASQHDKTVKNKTPITEQQNRRVKRASSALFAKKKPLDSNSRILAKYTNRQAFVEGGVGQIRTKSRNAK